ncbi:penicillin-binding transpeptidase domain-containing protein [Solirubrobacter soli]|uniref:penicillin-binding transpeptidase domain-containing protein n=1 Tax=Solirubrobacter soli TaxID=363832 RepID=UPI00042A2F69|nr:penicillin-binding transpeptidase domain-containing protein [Solirubrobacter soli]
MRWLAPLGLLLAVGAVALFFVTRSGGDPARDAFVGYAAAWSRADDRGAARATDDAGAAAAALAASRKGLDGATVKATVRDVTEKDDSATATVSVAWEIPRIGHWAYRVKLTAAKGEKGWVVHWRPTAIHPALDAGTRLGTAVKAPARGRIEDRDGRALMAERAVTAIDVDTRRVTDPADTASRIAALIDDIDAGELRKKIEAAPKGGFVPVITLRKTAYDKIAGELQDVPGASTAPGTAPLAPSKDFARALLGAVGPATAEQVERSDGRLAPGDAVGQWGLQAAFDARLAGTETRSIVVRDAKDGVVEKTLRRWKGKSAKDVQTTLDLDVQQAAEAALGSTRKKMALVALQPSTGDVLAVANRPSADTLDRALTGLYPPGSTFKVVTTAALLRDGLSVNQTVPCPATEVVDGRSFKNFEGEAAGAVPFRTDFAQSCNTAFISLADRLSRTALPDTAKDFGVGEQLKLGVPVADGKVPEGESATSRAAMMIGQDKIVATPLIMAGVAGTVAAGRWHSPRLLADDPKRTGPRVAQAATLRDLMRAVVTSGTGTALASLPGFVAGKSGTAEFGGGDPPPTHAWFIAFRDDLAVAVLVENGRAGGEVAAPIAAKFLAGL